MSDLRSRVRVNVDWGRLVSQVMGQDPVSALISNNVEYVLHIETGTRHMEARSMVWEHQREYQDNLRAAIEQGFELHPNDIARAMKYGVTSAALQVLNAVAERTPVDTGRAKGAWIATLPDGKQASPLGTSTVSEAEQRAIYRTEEHRAKRRERRKRRVSRGRPS